MADKSELDIIKELYNSFGNNPNNVETFNTLANVNPLLAAYRGAKTLANVAPSAIAKALRNEAYGIDNTADNRAAWNQIANTASGVMDVVPTLGMAKVAAKPTAKALGKALAMTENMPVGLSIKDVSRPLTDFEKAHKLAQQRAALPVSEGGLGLHPQNTAMERAKALGFDSDVYHGTPSPDIYAADYAHSGKGYDQYGASALYTTTEPHYASGFANPEIEGANVMPLKVRTDGFVPSDMEGKLTSSQIQHLINKSPDEYALSNFGDIDYEGRNKVLREAVNSYKDFGNDELLSQMNALSNDFYPNNPGEFNKEITNLTGIRGLTVDLGGNHKFQLPYDPKDIRSRFAAFDPFRRNEADILAGVGAGLPFVDYNKKK